MIHHTPWEWTAAPASAARDNNRVWYPVLFRALLKPPCCCVRPQTITCLYLMLDYGWCFRTSSDSFFMVSLYRSIASLDRNRRAFLCGLIECDWLLILLLLCFLLFAAVLVWSIFLISQSSYTPLIDFLIAPLRRASLRGSHVGPRQTCQKLS